MGKKSSNDDKILLLKKQIDEKKKDLKGIERFSPETNCSFVLLGERVNLNAASEQQLRDLVVFLNSLRLSVVDLGFEEYKTQGFTLDQWLKDVKAKLLILNKRQEEERLRALETQLTNLLSLEKKTELIIDELSGLI